MINERVYLEVYTFLNCIDKEHREKVPKKLRKIFENGKEQKSNLHYDLNIPLNEQSISKDAIAIIALLHYSYWCKSEEEKLRLVRIFNENTIQNELAKRKKYSPDDIFKNLNKTENDVNITETAQKESSSNQMIVYKESVFIKIMNFIKKFFKRK